MPKYVGSELPPGYILPTEDDTHFSRSCQSDSLRETGRGSVLLDFSCNLSHNAAVSGPKGK